MTSIDNAMQHKGYLQQKETDLVTVVDSLVDKVDTLETTLQQVLDNHIKEPEQEETITIGGNTYYKATLYAAACDFNALKYAQDLAKFIIDYPSTSKDYLVKPTANKPDIIQGDAPRPTFRYKGKYYSQYLLEKVKKSTKASPEEFINDYPATAEGFLVKYNG